MRTEISTQIDIGVLEIKHFETFLEIFKVVLLIGINLKH